MTIFDDFYGVLSLNALKHPTEEHEDSINENPFMEWGNDLPTISAEVNQKLSISIKYFIRNIFKSAA